MQKKYAATFTIAIFLLSTLAIINPAQAHFTLGNATGVSPYAVNNFDPHVAGPIGYVWPGSGENAYSGFPNVASANLSPGYQSPYPNGNPPGAPDNSWYQLQGDTYSPFGAVLTGSTGDLIFALNATCLPAQWTTGCNAAPKHELQGIQGQGTLQLSNSLGWDTWFILIPPEFMVPGATTGDSSQIISTLSNSYDRIEVTKLSPYDRFAPGWTMVQIVADAGDNAKGQSQSNEYYNHQLITFTNAGEWYYVRINGVTAPSIAGRYFFKMALYSIDQHAGFPGVGPTLAGPANTGHPENPFIWVPPQNWPVMLVKGEVDPAIITGTLRYAGYNATLYQQPIAEAAFVNATMTTRLNPYTGQAVSATCDPIMNGVITQNSCINAQAFVNATANGHYELEGLAPGVYTVYASAAGFPTQLCVSGITVLRGQSLHFDCYLQPGPVIHGNVFTKHQFGDEPWPGNSTTGQYMKIELYANPTLSNIVDPSAGPAVSWTPLPCVAGGQEDYYGRTRAAGYCGDPRDGSEIAAPWHEYSTVVGNQAGYYTDPASLFDGAANGYTRDVAKSVCLGAVDCNSRKLVLTSDPQGVGPPQSWYVAGGTTTPFHFEMGVKGEYGAPTWLSGEVPQVYATWVNGLTPGRYYVRAWTFRYVQTALDGSTFQEYYFDITPNEWAGDVTLPIDLRLSSWVNKTVYFHDTPNTIETNPIHSVAGFLSGTLVGADGHVYSNNVTALGLLENTTTTSACTNANLFVNIGGGCAFYSSLLGSTQFNYGLTPGTKLTGTPSAVTPFYYNGITSLSQGNACFMYDQRDYEFAVNNFNLFQTGEIGAPSQPCPFGTRPGQEVNALDKNGINDNSIATGKATIQFWGINDTWGGENYGIPSGTYTPNVYANGYAPLGAPEQVSVTLSGNPTSISDHLILAPGFNVSVYSIDWERPSVARPWVWSGCQDTGGFSQSGEACLGSEIDLGWYTNGTLGSPLADWFGPEPGLEPASVSFFNNFGGLFQGPGGIDCATGLLDSISCAQMDGGGRNVLPGYSNAHAAYFGAGSSYAFVGGYTPGFADSVFTTAKVLRSDSMFNVQFAELPSHFSEGQYGLGAYSYGYIQDQPYTAYAMNGQVADMRINLIEGVNVTLDVLFKKESIITPTPFNMSARVRLFNDQSQLVSEWMSSEGTYVDRSGHAIAANGQLPSSTSAAAKIAGPCATGSAPANCGLVGDSVFPLYPFQFQGGFLLSTPTGTSSGLNGYNYLPGGTTLLHVAMAGLPQQIPFGSDIVGVYYSDPVFTGFFCDFEVDCYTGGYMSYPFPNTGIAGAPDYTGGWTAEVDFVPWYNNNTQATTWSRGYDCGGFDLSSSTCYSTITNGAQYYPPVNGLLMGESYHIIPGTTATSRISLTEDAATSSMFVGHTMAPNHLGPYSQEGVWQIAGTHNSGEASAIFEVDLNGFISGQVLGFTWANEFRTQSWDTISVTGASGATLPSMYTFDGIYQGFFAPGSYSFTINAPGYTPQTWSISITPGESGTGQNIYLQQSQIPVPEFSSVAVIAFAALAASLYLLKRRRK